MRRGGKRLRNLLGFAKAVIEDQIARHIFVKLRGTGRERFFRGGDGGQGLDVQHNGLGRIARLHRRLRHDDRHRIADEAHLVARQGFAQGFQHRGAVAIGDVDDAFQRRIALPVEIGSGIDRDHTRHRARIAGIDTAQNAMCVRAAHEGGVELPVQGEVVGVTPVTTHQDGVLPTRDRLADLHIARGDIGESRASVHERGTA